MAIGVERMKRRRADKFGASLYALKTSPNFAFGNEDEHSIVQTQKNEIQREKYIVRMESERKEWRQLAVI